MSSKSTEKKVIREYLRMESGGITTDDIKQAGGKVKAIQVLIRSSMELAGLTITEVEEVLDTTAADYQVKQLWWSAVRTFEK